MIIEPSLQKRSEMILKLYNKISELESLHEKYTFQLEDDNSECSYSEMVNLTIKTVNISNQLSWAYKKVEQLSNYQISPAEVLIEKLGN